MKTCFEADYRVNYNVNNRSSESSESSEPFQNHTYRALRALNRLRVIHTWLRALRAVSESYIHDLKLSESSELARII